MAESLNEKNILAWDVYNWSGALKYWESILKPSQPLECLELGANKGGLSLWLASKGHHVICNDIRPVSDEVIQYHKQFNYSGKIDYESFDAVSIPYQNKFDIIILKSVLGGVGRDGKNERIELAIQEIYKALKPGGLFLFAENLKATKFHSFFRKNFVHWAKDWNYMEKTQFEKYMKPFSELNIKTAGFLGAFGFNETSKTILGKIDTGLFNGLPGGCHYIIYGYAKK